MSFAYLLIVGLLLIANHMVLGGIVLLLFAFCSVGHTQRSAALITGIVLIACVPGWLVGGIIGVIAWLVDSHQH